MSNPEGNVEKSAWYHRYAIWGIIAAVALAVIAFLIFAPMRDPDAVETPVDAMETSTNIQTPDAAITTGTPDPVTTTAD